jgi:predicted ribosome quality control (RQC) complex YloA/Tae2 family protein
LANIPFLQSGNVILTDSDLKILTLLRNVPEGEGQEPQRVGLQYSLENRQNYPITPPLTKDRVRAGLQTAVDRAAIAAAAGKKTKSKPGDELRKSLATTITELPPMVVEHAFELANFKSSTKPAEILQNEDLLEALFKATLEARRLVEEATSAERCKGYIFAKLRPNASDTPANTSDEPKREDLLYEDFHPFLPQKFVNDPNFKVLAFDGFNKTVDEFFSSLEGQKLESRLNEREAAAKRKLDAARRDQEKRIEGLQETQMLNLRKAAAIEANLERVQEAMDAVTGLIQQGMDWHDIGKLVEREQTRRNPVAETIKLPLNLNENTITLLLAEEEDGMDEEDEAYETDSSADSDDSEAANTKQKAADKRLLVDVNLGLSSWSNAREYYDQKRTASVKEQKTVQQATIALRNAEQKITEDLKKGLKQEKAVLQPIRKQMWFEKFIWFISSDAYLVLAGKDAQQNEMLYKRYLRKGDIYCHADLHGAATVIIKNNPSTPDAPIPPSTLSQAGTLAVCTSNAWDSKAGMAAWWVNADQVSKSAPTGEFLPTGSFMVRGKKNFLPPAQLILGFGLMFKISDQSKAKHVKHRLHDSPRSAVVSSAPAPAKVKNESEKIVQVQDTSDHGDESTDEDQDQDDNQPRANPLQSLGNNGEDEDEDEDEDDESAKEVDTAPAADVSSPSTPGVQLYKSATDAPSKTENIEAEEVAEEDEQVESEGATSSTKPPGQPSSKASTTGTEKKGQPKRGQRGKAKKMAKYKDQDDEDRAAIEAIIGSAVGRQRAEEEAKAKAQRELDLQAQKERRRAQHQRQQKETAEHEEVRRLMLDEGVEMLDEDEAERTTLLDSLVGTPLVGDEILEVIPVCAPWNAMAKIKFKAKMQPGPVKKGKAIKEVFERWRVAAGKKGTVDEQSQDTERMWPREVELIKGIKPEDVINCVPVSKVKIMMPGGGSAGGVGRAGSGGGKGGGKGGGGR